MDGEIEAREHRLVDPFPGVMAAERRGVDERDRPRTIRQEQRRAGDVQGLIQVDRDDRRRTLAHQHLAQTPQRPERELAGALELLQRNVTADARLDRERAIEAGQRHVDTLILQAVREAHDLALGAADAEIVQDEEHVGAGRRRRGRLRLRTLQSGQARIRECGGGHGTVPPSAARKALRSGTRSSSSR
jgi:hypothetical protein